MSDNEMFSKCFAEYPDQVSEAQSKFIVKFVYDRHLKEFHDHVMAGHDGEKNADGRTDWKTRFTSKYGKMFYTVDFTFPQKFISIGTHICMFAIGYVCYPLLVKIFTK